MSIRFGNFQISAFTVPHDGESCCGFLIQHPETTLLYMTDLEFCGYRFSKYKPDTLLIEANYDKSLVSAESMKREHVLRGHAEIETTLGIIEANKTNALRRVILCHLSHENADPIDFTTRAQEVAGKGVTVDFAAAGKAWDIKNADDCPFM